MKRRIELCGRPAKIELQLADLHECKDLSNLNESSSGTPEVEIASNPNGSNLKVITEADLDHIFTGVDIKREEQTEYSLKIQISYCPFCGKKL